MRQETFEEIVNTCKEIWDTESKFDDRLNELLESDDICTDLFSGSIESLVKTLQLEYPGNDELIETLIWDVTINGDDLELYGVSITAENIWNLLTFEDSSEVTVTPVRWR